jgi:hypothetical protein
MHWHTPLTKVKLASQDKHKAALAHLLQAASTVLHRSHCVPLKKYPTLHSQNKLVGSNMKFEAVSHKRQTFETGGAQVVHPL